MNKINGQLTFDGSEEKTPPPKPKPAPPEGPIPAVHEVFNLKMMNVGFKFVGKGEKVEYEHGKQPKLIDEGRKSTDIE